MNQLRGKRRQTGQSLVETVVVIGVFGTFLLGIFQAILFYRAKTVVDYAALEAARSGATHFAEKEPMRLGFLRGLMPLYTHKSSNEGLLDGYRKTLVAVHNPLVTRIDVISPTRAVFDDFKMREFDGVEAIPNGSLAFRSSAPGASGLSVQDANILKIRVVYGYKMIVPVIDKIVIGLFRSGLYKGMSTTEVAMLESGRLPIVSQATVRMQTPIRDRDLLASTDVSGGGGSADQPDSDGNSGGDDGPRGNGNQGDGTASPSAGDPGGGPPGGGNPGAGDGPVCDEN